ncbi:hypothetical protein GF325_11870 [Candidatus Bathyarchaeota archaeon]|nr:hypothetical protein [Candidatus Bathyarchaeota archaeon]
MPILWDTIMAISTGFFFSSGRKVVHNTLGLDLDDKITYTFGLVFTLFSNMIISIWCWTDVDQNWLMLYWFDPAILGDGVFFIYTAFPLFYSAGYAINMHLIEREHGRYSLLLISVAWLGFTLAVFPRFVTLFRGNDIPLHGIDYPPQFLWDLREHPARNVLWIFGMSYRQFFLMFTVIVVCYLLLFTFSGYKIARHDFYRDAPKGKPSRLLVFLAGFALDFSHKQLIKTVKKDYRFRQFVKNFEATIQFSTRDKRINRFLVFDGAGSVVYAKGTASIQESSTKYAEIVYRSARDMLKVLASFGDIYEGMLENRFELKGNLSLLYKYQFLTSFYNPTTTLVRGAKQSIIKEFRGD